MYWKLLTGWVVLFSAGCHLSGSAGGTQSGSPTELTGTWFKSCTAVAGTTTGTSYSVQTIVLGNASVESTEIFFSNLACTQKLYTKYQAGSYSIPGDSTVVDDAKNINFDFTTLIITPYDQTLVNDYNSGVFYGSDSWVLNEEEDVSSYVKDLYQIYVKASGYLTMGLLTSTYNGETAAARPRSMDTFTSYVLQ